MTIGSLLCLKMDYIIITSTYIYILMLQFDLAFGTIFKPFF